MMTHYVVQFSVKNGKLFEETIIYITYNTKTHLKLNNIIRLSKLNLDILCIFNHSVCVICLINTHILAYKICQVL